MRRRSWWLVGVATMAGVVVLGAATGVAVARSSSRGALVVTVGGLPRSVTPRARLIGPRGFSEAVRRSMQRFSGLAPGRYVLAISPARGQGVTWSAGRVKHVSVRVGRGVTRVSVAYMVGVRDGTVQVAAGQVVGAVLSPQGGGTLVLSKKGAQGLVRGGYVVVGMTKATPKGFLGHIVSITPHGPAAVEVHAGPAGITDVVPEGDFQVNIPAKQEAAASSFRASSRRKDGRAASADEFLNGVKCSDSASLNLSGQASASIGAKIQFTHHFFSFHPSVGVRLEADADQSASVTASLSGAASCTLDDTQIGPDIPLGDYLIDVPFTPLTFIASPVLAFSINGEASASAAASTQAGESAHADAGIQWTNGHISPFASFTHQFSYQAPSFTGKATLRGAVKAAITIGIDGTELGPDFALQNGLTLTADPNANPCWKLTDELSATAGLDLHDLVTIPDYTVYETTFPLAQSGQSCSASVTLSNPGDQTTVKGTAVDLPIKATRTDGGTLTYTASGLPTGLMIDSATGVITGAPTASGVNSVTITATDSTGPSGQTSFKWTIPSLSATNPGDQHTEVNTPVSLQIQANDTDPNAVVTYTAQGLPPGLVINRTTGLITQTPTTTGKYSVVVTVQDSNGTTIPLSFTWLIEPPPNYGHWVGTVTYSYDGAGGPPQEDLSYSNSTDGTEFPGSPVATANGGIGWEMVDQYQFEQDTWSPVNGTCSESITDSAHQPVSGTGSFLVNAYGVDYSDAPTRGTYNIEASKGVTYTQTFTQSGPSGPPDNCTDSTNVYPSEQGDDASVAQPSYGQNPEHLQGSATVTCSASTSSCTGGISFGGAAYTQTTTWDIHLVGSGDADGDGVDDYIEFINGTDPLDPKSVPPPGSPGVP
jgi:hypothetical protein